VSAPARVLLLAGSPSDLDLVLDCEETLAELGIASEIRVLSAHRTPDEAAAGARGAESTRISRSPAWRRTWPA